MGCCQGHLLWVRAFGGQGDNRQLTDTRGMGSEAPLGPSDILPALPDEGCGVSPSNESYWVSQAAGLSQGYDSQASHLVRPTLPVSTESFICQGRVGRQPGPPQLPFGSQKRSSSHL